jgi:uncharacterized membrane protein YedE/YeeE
MRDLISTPWPWYVAGPLIGLIVPLLLLVGRKRFGISSSLQHACAAAVPCGLDYFTYDWRREGTWLFVCVLGVLVGGFVAATAFADPDAYIKISDATRADLTALGLTDLSGLVPREVFSWAGLLTIPGLAMVVGGSFLVGFGARYAGGCTSGHAITGMAELQVASLVAVIGFFIGGLCSTHLLLPFLL